MDKSRYPSVVGRFEDVVFSRCGEAAVDEVGWIVRVRRGNLGTYLELKERRSSDTWIQTSVSIDDSRAAMRILWAIGLRPHLVLVRERTAFQLDNGEISFDDIESVGRFVEFEANDGDVAGIPVAEPICEPLAQYVLDAKYRLPAYGDLVLERSQQDEQLRSYQQNALERVLEEIQSETD